MDARPVCQGLCSPTANMGQWSKYVRHFCHWSALTLPSSDIDECFNSIVCGPEAKCTNTPGSFICSCNKGWAPTKREEEPRQASNNCTGKEGWKNSPQWPQRKLQQDTNPFLVFDETSDFSMYKDIVECEEHPTICGPNANCTNLIGSHNCTCDSGYRLNNLEVIASVTNPCTGVQPLVWCVCSCTCYILRAKQQILLAM